MQGHALYRRSTFFVDVINVIFYVDLFLYHDLELRMKSDQCLEYYFSEKLPKIAENESPQQFDVRLVHELAGKHHLNILEDWINKDKFLKENSEDDYIVYLMSLYHLMLTKPIYDNYMQTTEFASALKLLTKDDKLDKIIFYIPFDSPVITENIIESFGGYNSGKISIMIGGKVSNAIIPVADSYVLEDIGDVDLFLKVSHEYLTEVIVPAYEYNLATDRNEEEKLYEQVTIQRLRLNDSGSDYQTRYNLSINSIKVPI